MRPNMAPSAYKKGSQAQPDNWRPRIDKGQLKVRLPSADTRKIITGAQFLHEVWT